MECLMSRSDGRIHDGHGESLAVDMLKGALAGAAAVWVMDRVDWFNLEHEDPEARRQTQRVRPGGMDPAHVAANKAADMAGTELDPHQPHPAGIAAHYGLGIFPGALYAAMRDRAAGLGMARGPLYGMGLFLMQDEGLNAVSGLSARPGQYPWQAHARGLMAHLVYGLVLDSTLNVLDSVDRSVRQTDGGAHRYYARSDERHEFAQTSRDYR
jgi:hypothetical protein